MFVERVRYTTVNVIVGGKDEKISHRTPAEISFHDSTFATK